jgi:hypothetical protein
MSQFIQWLLRELSSRPQEPPVGRDDAASRLRSIRLHLRVDCITDIDIKDAAALSEVLSDDRHFPLLKEVALLIVTDPEASEGLEESIRRGREQIVSAMRTLEEKGILDVQCE